MVPSRFLFSRRKLLAAALVCALCLLGAAVLLRLALPALVGSAHTRRYVTKYAEGKSGLPVAVGSLSYGGRGRFVCRDVVLGDPAAPFASLPHAELHLSLRGLVKGRAGALLLVNPEFFVSAPQDGGQARGFAAPPVDSIRLVDGVAHLRRGGEGKLLVGPFSASFETDREGALLLRGETALPFFDAPLAFEGAIDPSRLALSDTTLSLKGVRLAPLLPGSPLGGTADIRVELLQAGAGEAKISVAGELSAVTLGTSQGGGPHSGELTSRLVLSQSYRHVLTEGTVTLRQEDDPGTVHELRYEAAYDGERGELTLAAASLNSGLLGAVEASGSVFFPPSGAPAWALALRGKGLPLHLLLRRLPDDPLADILNAAVDSTVEIRGRGAELREAAIEGRSYGLDVAPESPLVFLQGRTLHTEAVVTTAAAGVWAVKGLTLGIGELPPWRFEGLLRRGEGAFPALDGVVTIPETSLRDLQDLLVKGARAWTERVDGEGKGSAEIAIKGPLDAPLLTGTVKVEGPRLQVERVRISPFAAAVSFAFSHSTLTVRNVHLEAEEVRVGAEPPTGTSLLMQRAALSAPLPFTLPAKALPLILPVRAQAAALELTHRSRARALPGSSSLEGRLAFNPGASSLALTDGVFRYGQGPEIALRADLIWSPAISLDLEVAADALDLGGMTPPTGEFNVAGTAGVVATGRAVSRAGGYSVAGTVVASIDGGGYSTADGSRAAEGISLESTASWELLLPEAAVQYDFKVRAGGFELVQGLFYGDFRERETVLNFSGKAGGKGDAFEVEKVDLVLEDLCEARFRGSAGFGRDGRTVRGRLTAAIPSHRRFFDFFLRETFGERLPWLAGMEAEGSSRAQLEVSLAPEGSFAITGEVHVDRLDLRSPGQGLALEGLGLSLPVLLTSRRAGDDSTPPSYGVLGWREIRWGGVRIPPQTVFPSVYRNRLSFREDIALPLWGGRIVLHGVTGRDLLSPRRNLSLAAKVYGLDLGLLAGALDLPAMRGSLDGSLPSLTYLDGSLSSRGRLSARIFGGTLSVEDLRVEELWGPVPSLRLSLRADRIDLAEITGILGFGSITGLIEGQVDGLVVTAGEAQEFQARFETVKERGVPRKISVEALENISILASGEQAGILDRGIYQFFKEYRYEKMGFSATLKNDHLRLSGVHQEGGRTYLVKGGLFPPKADVISHSRDISFGELVKRLKRVGRVGGKKEGEGRSR